MRLHYIRIARVRRVEKERVFYVDDTVASSGRHCVIDITTLMNDEGVFAIETVQYMRNVL